MKNSLTIAYVLLGVVVIGLLGSTVIFFNYNLTESKSKLLDYADMLYDSIGNLSSEDANKKLNSLGVSDEISCSDVMVTNNKELILNNCTIKNGMINYCYYKNKIYTCDDKEYKAIAANNGINLGDIKVNSGELVKIKVGTNEVYNFYILDEDKNTVTAIMDRNIGNNVVWISNEDAEEAGYTDYEYEYLKEHPEIIKPLTANKELERNTSSWNNAIEVRLPEAMELLKQTKKKDFKDIQTDYFEKYIASCKNADCVINNYPEVLLPEWLVVNLLNIEADDVDFKTDDVAYHTSTLGTGKYFGLTFVVANADNARIVSLSEEVFCGVRPVVKIDKKYIVK